MFAEYVLVFFVIFAASVFIVDKWNGKKRPARHLPPSLPSLPFIGSLPFIRDIHNIGKFFAEKSIELGPIFIYRVGNKVVLALNSRDVIEEALVKNGRSFSSRPELLLQKIINPQKKGIIFMENSPKWKRIHQLSLSILREFGFGDKNIMEARILREVEAMVEYCRKREGKPFDPKDLSCLMTSNIIMNIIFGSRRDFDLGISELTHQINRAFQQSNMILNLAPFLRFIPPFKKYISSMKDCKNKYCDIIEKEIDRTLQSKDICFVSEYVKTEGPNYDRQQLTFLLRDLIAAGTDTTANTFRWALVALVNNPEIQKRLQKDIDSVIPRHRLPTLQDQTKLPYVEATILELYRWRTVVPMAIAHCAQQDSTVNGFFVPAGTPVFPNLYAAHTHPEDWKDPDVFRPERFLDESGNVVGKDRVISFSLGRRSCLGEILARAEIFLFLTSLLQRFTILLPDGQDKICDQPYLPVTIISAPKPFSIRLLERQFN